MRNVKDLQIMKSDLRNCKNEIIAKILKVFCCVLLHLKQVCLCTWQGLRIDKFYKKID